jgi:hypothetical protein
VGVSLLDRIRELKERHARLERALDDEISRPRPKQEEIAALKRRKLLIKDQIAEFGGIAGEQQPASPAWQQGSFEASEDETEAAAAFAAAAAELLAAANDALAEIRQERAETRLLLDRLEARLALSDG